MTNERARNLKSFERARNLKSFERAAQKDVT
jgi:hypothetical protein